MAEKMRYKKSAKEIELEQKVSIPMIFRDFIVPEIPSYYSLYPADFKGTPVACCPLHDEDTPSCRYYEDTNSFYCFGCGKGGNIVNLYVYFYNRMRDANITKKDAIDFLYRYYIEGNELAVLPSAKKQEVLKNNAVDTIRFNKYRIEIEELISFEKTISLDKKEKIWELLDNIDVLFTKGLIDVNEASQYIRTEINKILA